MKKGLFIYGTLHPDRAPQEIRGVVDRLKPIGSGTVRGELHDLGEYPALAPRGKRQPVPGALFALPEDPGALRMLDAYEEFDPQKPETSLFRRRNRVVTLQNGRKERHWVYVYNRELPVAS